MSASGWFATYMHIYVSKEFFFKKIKNLCRAPAGLALGKENFQKKIKALCRVPHGLALGKEYFFKK